MDSVHMFWFGGPLPPKQQLCLRSFVACGYEPQLWVYQDYDVPAGVQLWDAGEIAHESVAQAWLVSPIRHAKQTFANYFRYKLLHAHGGWWADTDILCLRQLPVADYVFTAVHDIPTRPEILSSVGGPPVGGNLANGLFRVPADDPIMAELVSRIEPHALAANVPSLFGHWGTILFTQAAHRHNRRTIVPLIGNGIQERDHVCTKPDFVPPPWARVLHLYNYGGDQVIHPQSFYAKFERGLTSQTCCTASS